ncbi:MAG: Hsp70 family protein, partial [Acidimicrobiia bacterium]
MSYHLGVDLGTSFTAAAIERDGVVTVVELGRQRPQIPTVVHIAADGQLVVGDAAERRAVSDPEGIARDFKRRLGDQVGTMVRTQLWSAESLLAAVLSYVLTAVTAAQGGAPAGVTLSHPAHWGPYKLDLLREVARLAGLPDARFVAEPTAAALHATASSKTGAGRPVVVYDLGGGTFDVSMVRTGEVNGSAEEAGELIGQPDGLERLGGIDFDEALRQLV